MACEDGGEVKTNVAIDLYAEISKAVDESVGSVFDMDYKAGADKIRQLVLDRMHALGVRSPRLDMMAAIDAQIALAVVVNR